MLVVLGQLQSVINKQSDRRTDGRKESDSSVVALDMLTLR